MKRTLAIVLALLACAGLLAPCASADGFVQLKVDSAYASAQLTTHTPMNLIDGLDDTNWQVRLGDSSKVSDVSITFVLSSPSDLNQLWLKNGHWGQRSDGQSSYLRNARASAIAVYVQCYHSNAFTYVATIAPADDASCRDWQRYDIGETVGVTAVRLTLLGYTHGTAYPNDIVMTEAALCGYGIGTAANPVTGLAIQNLATRLGPGTSFQGSNTYPLKGQWVQVLSRAFDSSNGIWWVKFEVTVEGAKEFRWTSYKRFDAATLPLESIPIEPGY